MNKPIRHLIEFVGLKANVVATAEAALERKHPEYVAAFRKRIRETGDYDATRMKVEALLGDGIPPWRDVLEEVHAVEVTLDKVRQSLEFLRADVVGPDEGTWTSYHMDHWLLQAYAWLDAVERLVTVFYQRVVAGPRSAKRESESPLLDAVQRIKTTKRSESDQSIEELRGDLAHGHGWGVKGISEGMWEPWLLSDPKEDIVYTYYEVSGYHREDWHDRLVVITGAIIAEMERDVFAKLNALFPGLTVGEE